MQWHLLVTEFIALRIFKYVMFLVYRWYAVCYPPSIPILTGVQKKKKKKLFLLDKKKTVLTLSFKKWKFAMPPPSLIFHVLVMDSLYLYMSEVVLCKKDSFYNITYSWPGMDGIQNLLLMCHSGKLSLPSFVILVKSGLVSKQFHTFLQKQLFFFVAHGIYILFFITFGYLFFISFLWDCHAKH